MMDEQKEQRLAKQSRLVSLVIAGTLILWMLIQVVGQQIGLPGRYALLFDFAALAALIWALVNVFMIWRARRTTEG